MFDRNKLWRFCEKPMALKAADRTALARGVAKSLERGCGELHVFRAGVARVGQGTG